ncbi:MAG TPA: DUF4012 domain-containing protein [Acidimicrobiales bacterium]
MFGFRFDEQRHAYILRRIGQERGPVIRDARLRGRLVRYYPDEGGSGSVGGTTEAPTEAEPGTASTLPVSSREDETRSHGASRPSSPTEPMTAEVGSGPGGGGQSRPPRRPRRWRRWTFGVLALGILVWLGFVALSLVRAVQDAHSAQSAADAARSQLTNTGAGVLSTQSTATLQQANRRFAALDSDLSSPALTPLTVVPWVGTQVRSARAVASSADKVSATGVVALNQANAALAQEHGPGPGRIVILRQLATIADTARASLAGLDTGPSSGLVGTLATRHSQLVSDISKAQVGLTKSAAASRAAADMLATPGQYLLVAANNAEMRNGQGIVLQAGLLTTNNGTTHLVNMQSVGDLPVSPPGATVPADVEALWSKTTPSLFWQSLGVTPQFNVTGPIAAQLWGSSATGHVDGAILVDVEGLQQLMTATGPVDVNGTTVTPDNVVPLLMNGQYQGLTSGVTDQTNRRELLGSLSRSTFQALESGGANLKTLATGLARAANGRHIIVWTAAPNVQGEWQTAGAAGQMESNDVLAGLVNFAGNKLDWFLKVSNTLQVQPGAGYTDVTITMHLSNQTPNGQPSYVAGVGSPNEYSAVAAVSLPASATGATLNGLTKPEIAGREGPNYLLGQTINVPQGKSTDVTVRFRLPGQHGQVRVVPSARVPVVSWDGQDTFTETGVHTVSW